MKSFLFTVLSICCLQASAQTDTAKIKLNEVKIVGRQSLIQQRTDRSVIVVNNQIRQLADHALDLLRLAPGITISDNEDALQMNGKDAVEVMINDKVVKMSGRDLVKLLKSLPIATVAQLEIMTNPSAKYDISGNSGLLNIKTKRISNNGITGNVDLSHSQAGHSMGDLSNTLNYGADQLAVSSYLAYHYGNYPSRSNLERLVDQGKLDQVKNSADKWRDPALRLTAEYYIDDKQILGALLAYERSRNTGSYEADATLFPDFGVPTKSHTRSFGPNTSNWKTYNLNYRFADTLGTEFSLDLDRSLFHKDNLNTVTTTFSIQELDDINYQTFTGIAINSLKGDYSRNWKTKLKLEAGFKISGVRTDNELSVHAAPMKGGLVERSKDNFLYREDVNAAYVNLGKSYLKWGWQMGLRLEHSKIKGMATSDNESVLIKPDSVYWNLMPAVYLTFRPSSVHNFRLSVNQRIKRPNYTALRPFTYQIDAFNVETGNPGLRVQKNTNAELSYSFKDRITISASYAHTDDFFTPVLFLREDVFYQTTANAGTMDNWNFLLNYPVKVSRWWNMVNKLTGFHNQFNGQLFQGVLDDGKWSYGMSTAQRFNLPKNYLVTLNARYTSSLKNLIYSQRDNANVSIGISKKLFKEQASFRIGVSDLFETQRTYTDVNFMNLIYSECETWESRRFSMGFSWQFGNKKVRQTKERSIGGADEKSRS
ncbi:outer membrane beta-barrel protein [Pedobacter duraquae]|uniref:Outer membrane beta-barrel protein n=1 Tax=Pedobacter duraquae TaxID=425511 RepID=A0A4R6IQG8_9SPHI|nr:outer membrane beta-barrel protein [Pedobacter duraquae]TDO24441.1 outer membrane beta-barrel protein [Pedobacter duraquae]